MSQEHIAGFLLCVIGLALNLQPTLVWKLTEKWKGKGREAPSARYIAVLRIVGGAALGVGFLLATGILR